MRHSRRNGKCRAAGKPGKRGSTCQRTQRHPRRAASQAARSQGRCNQSRTERSSRPSTGSPTAVCRTTTSWTPWRSRGKVAGGGTDPREHRKQAAVRWFAARRGGRRPANGRQQAALHARVADESDRRTRNERRRVQHPCPVRPHDGLVALAEREDHVGVPDLGAHEYFLANASARVGGCRHLAPPSRAASRLRAAQASGSCFALGLVIVIVVVVVVVVVGGGGGGGGGLVFVIGLVVAFLCRLGCSRQNQLHAARTSAVPLDRRILRRPWHCAHDSERNEK